MHYKDGTPAEQDDLIVYEDYAGRITTGRVTQRFAQAETCNLVVARIAGPDQPILPYGVTSDTITASSALLVARNGQPVRKVVFDYEPQKVAKEA